MLAGSHRNAWPDETGTGGRTNRNTQHRRLWYGASLAERKNQLGFEEQLSEL